MSWFLVDMDDGIIDKAPTKRSLMKRNGFVKSNREGRAYLVYPYNSDGIGTSYYIIKDSDMSLCGFDWALNQQS